MKWFVLGMAVVALATFNGFVVTKALVESFGDVGGWLGLAWAVGSGAALGVFGVRWIMER